MSCDRQYDNDVIQQLQDIETLCRLKELLASEGWKIVRNRPMYRALPDMAVLNSLVQRDAMKITLEEIRALSY